MKNKKGMGALAIGLIVLVLVAVGGVGYLVLDKGSDTLSIVKNGAGPTVCDSTTTPEVDIREYDFFNPGTALTEATNLYRIKGQKTWSTFTADTAFAASPGDVLEVVMGITTSDMTDNAYGEKFEYTVPCDETPTIEKAVYNDEVETSLTATFKNADGDAAAETFLAGQAQTVTLKFETGTDEAYGNPYGPANPNVLCLNLNKTAWDAPEWVRVDGKSMSRASVPVRHSVDSTDTAYCYEAPAIVNGAIEFEIRLDADDTNAPAVDDTASLYAGNWYINDQSEVVFGIEDEDGNAVGTDDADTLTLDFT